MSVVCTIDQTTSPPLDYVCEYYRKRSFNCLDQY